MKQEQTIMRPHDIVVLLKIIIQDKELWLQKTMSEEIMISQSEFSKSLSRSQYAGLLDSSGRNVSRLALMGFLEKGVAYTFPQKPGAIVRGVPTSHSASPLQEQIESNENYVWPSAKGKIRGQAIIPLYKSAPDAAQLDSRLYQLLVLIDAIRVGRAREKKIAISELKSRIL